MADPRSPLLTSGELIVLLALLTLLALLAGYLSLDRAVPSPVLLVPFLRF